MFTFKDAENFNNWARQQMGEKKWKESKEVLAQTVRNRYKETFGEESKFDDAVTVGMLNCVYGRNKGENHIVV